MHFLSRILTFLSLVRVVWNRGRVRTSVAWTDHITSCSVKGHTNQSGELVSDSLRISRVNRVRLRTSIILSSVAGVVASYSVNRSILRQTLKGRE